MLATLDSSNVARKGTEQKGRRSGLVARGLALPQPCPAPPFLARLSLLAKHASVRAPGFPKAGCTLGQGPEWLGYRTGKEHGKDLMSSERRTRAGTSRSNGATAFASPCRSLAIKSCRVGPATSPLALRSVAVSCPLPESSNAERSVSILPAPEAGLGRIETQSLVLLPLTAACF